VEFRSKAAVLLSARSWRGTFSDREVEAPSLLGGSEMLELFSQIGTCCVVTESHKIEKDYYTCTV